MSDYFIRATAADLQVRAFAATTRDLTEFARKAHNTSPIATAALGRLMTAAVMMGGMMKNDADLLTIRIEGNGPMKGLLASADCNGHVKGYVYNPDVMLPPNEKGKLDVGGAVGGPDGLGVLNVIKDIGLKEPYVGQTILVNGEIAEDLTYYFATSEQTPSSVGLGVLMNKNNTVKQAGGIIIQLLPNASEEVISKLEERIAKISSITSLLDQNMSPEDILQSLLGDMGLEITDKTPCSFYCNCSKDRVAKALISIGEKELTDMINDNKPIDVNCHFCNTNYHFDVDELKELLSLAKH